MAFLLKHMGSLISTAVYGEEDPSEYTTEGNDESTQPQDSSYNHTQSQPDDPEQPPTITETTPPNSDSTPDSPVNTISTTPPQPGEITTRRWRSNSARGLKQVDLQNVNILVVDDDPVQRAVLRKWLHDEGYKNGMQVTLFYYFTRIFSHNTSHALPYYHCHHIISRSRL